MTIFGHAPRTASMIALSASASSSLSPLGSVNWTSYAITFAPALRSASTTFAWRLRLIGHVRPWRP